MAALKVDHCETKLIAWIVSNDIRANSVGSYDIVEDSWDDSSDKETQFSIDDIAKMIRLSWFNLIHGPKNKGTTEPHGT